MNHKYLTYLFSKKHIISFFIIISFLFGLASFIQADVIYYNGYEDNYDGMGLRHGAPGASISRSTDQARAGSYSSKHYLNDTCPSDYCSYRAELTTGNPSKFVQGSEYWIGHSIYLPSDYVADVNYEVIMQWHGTPDPGESCGGNPPIALSVTNGNLKLTVIWTSNPDTCDGQGFPNTDYDGFVSFNLGAMPTGQWVDFVWHIKFEYDNSGLLELWQNGVKVVTHNNGTMFNDVRGSGLQMGIYKGAFKYDDRPSNVSDFTLYRDEFRIGDSSSSYAEVAPGGDPPPSDTEDPTIDAAGNESRQSSASNTTDAAGNESGQSSASNTTDAAGNESLQLAASNATTFLYDTIPPTNPTSLQATAISSSQINLSWNASMDDIGVTSYGIYRDGVKIATTANTTYQDTGLSPFTTYSYKVSAYDAAGNESWQSDASYTTDVAENESGQSAATSATTLFLDDTTPPTNPTSLQATAISTFQINLSWNASTDDIGVTSYGIYRDGVKIATTTNTTYQDKGLSPLTTYTYTVSAYDAAGNEGWQSAESYATTFLYDTTPLTTSTGIQATAISTFQINLFWNASTDNSGVTSYVIYRDGALIATTTNTTYQDTGLNPLTTYTYTVSAYDAAGNEGWQSAATYATTLLDDINAAYDSD